MQYNFNDLKIELKKAEAHLEKTYRELNIGRASPMVLDGVSVEVYGQYQPIKNIASINIEDPKTLRLAPWDKTQIKAIEKAIMLADLGLSLAVDDAGIRVIFPQLTTETRGKLAKVLKEKLEDARISVRKIRGDAWEEIQEKQKAGDMTEDERQRAKDELEKIVSDINKNLEEMFSKKESEVMN